MTDKQVLMICATVLLSTLLYSWLGTPNYETVCDSRVGELSACHTVNLRTGQREWFMIGVDKKQDQRGDQRHQIKVIE